MLNYKFMIILVLFGLAYDILLVALAIIRSAPGSQEAAVFTILGSALVHSTELNLFNNFCLLN